MYIDRHCSDWFASFLTTIQNDSGLSLIVDLIACLDCDGGRGRHGIKRCNTSITEHAFMVELWVLHQLSDQHERGSVVVSGGVLSADASGAC